MLTIEKIIEEADLRVPNAFSTPDKVDWLNEVNREFFDVVKIPALASFTTEAATADYPLENDVRSKNITKVMVGNSIYRSMLYEDVNPGHNYFTFDDVAGAITLEPQPATGKKGIATYNKIGTTNFISTTLTVNPDAPEEYHWLYILGLCERMAKAMNDVTLANNYANDYRNNLMLAQQNFQREQ